MYPAWAEYPGCACCAVGPALAPPIGQLPCGQPGRVACSAVTGGPAAASSADAGAPATTWWPVAITPPPALLRLPGQELRRTIARVGHHSAPIRPASAGFAASDAPMTCELIRRPGSNPAPPIPRLTAIDLHRCGGMRFLSNPSVLSRFGPVAGQSPPCGHMGTCLSSLVTDERQRPLAGPGTRSHHGARRL